MDYSELSKTELIERVKLNNAIINNVPIGFCITNQDGIYEFVNEAYCDIYGYTENELIGEHFSLVTTAENREELVKLHADFLNAAYELSREWTVKNKDGKKLNISAFAAKVTETDGREGA